MKKNPMVMRTRAKWGYTDGLIGLTYGDMSSCKGRDGQKKRERDERNGASSGTHSGSLLVHIGLLKQNVAEMQNNEGLTILSGVGCDVI